MKRVVALFIATAVLAIPASALGAPQLAAPIPTVHAAQATTSPLTAFPGNVTPNRKALNAYAAYLTAIIEGASAAQAADTAYIATISGASSTSSGGSGGSGGTGGTGGSGGTSGSYGCKSALQPLTQPSQQVNTLVQHTLTVLGEEMGDDLSIAFDQPTLPAFTKFSTTLLHLHWVRLSGALAVVKHYVTAETAVLAMLPSELCQDAVLAGANPEKVPDGTKTFVKSYDKASTLANLTLANLTKMMQGYEVSGEKGLVTRITTLANQVATLTKSDLLQSGAALSSTLESS